MRYSVIFWDSGGTIFSSEKDLKGLNNIPTPGVVASKRVFRVELAMKMFGHTPPPNLSSLIGDLSKELSKQYGAYYSLEMLARELYTYLNINNIEETLIIADAIAGPRYRSWLYPGVGETLSKLYDNGIRMGLIANTVLTTRMMRNMLAGVGLIDFFETIICSSDLGVRKPDPRIFKEAFDSLALEKTPKDSILYVGDTIEADINGAVSYGWDAALHLTTPENPQTKAIYSFREYDKLVNFIIG